MKIQLKRSNTLDNGSAKEPTAGQMEYGELAVNYNDTDPAVFLKDSNDNIIRIAGAGSIGSDQILSGDTLPGGVDAGTVFFNTTNDTLYYWNGSSWIAINGEDTYVDVSGDNMTGNLTLGTDKVILNASTGDGAFAGKVSTAATLAGDGATTLTTKGYVDSNRTVPGSGTLNIKDGTGTSLGTFNANAAAGTETVISLPASVAPTDPGDGKLTIKTNGHGASSTGTFTANQGGDSILTLPAIRYQDISGTPTTPTAPGAGTLNIKDSTGSSLGTFNANADTGTETVISLPASVAPTEPGDGKLTIKTNGHGASSTGTFTANQGGDSILTLPAIRYQDILETPTIPTAPGAGTLNIKDSTGSSLGTFNANADTGTETVISLPASVAPTEPGDGALTIKNYNDNKSAEGSFNANQGSGSTITLKQIKYNDISGTPSIPAAANDGIITIKQPGTTDQTFTVNQSGNTTVTLKNDNTTVTPGDGALTIKNFNDSSAAGGSFTANQGSGSTLTLKQIKYNDISGTPSIPAAANDGMITIKQPGTTDQTFTVNQSGNTTVTLKNDNTTVTPGDGALTIKNYNDSSAAGGSFTANQGSGSTLTLKQIKYNDISGTPSIPAAANSGALNIKNFNDSNIATGTFNANNSGTGTLTLRQINYNDLSNKPSIPTVSPTNLGHSTTTTAVEVTSSTGDNTILPSATGTNAGVMTTTQVSDLSTAKSTASSANTNADSRVLKSGDTMTGNLTLTSSEILINQSGGNLKITGGNDLGIENTGVLGLYSMHGDATNECSIIMDGYGCTVNQQTSQNASGIRYQVGNAWIGWRYVTGVGVELVYNNTPWFTIQAQYSDVRLKKDIADLTPDGGALSVINQLRPVEYRFKDLTPWNTQRQLEKNPEGTYKWGFIAQEIGEVIPEAFIIPDATEDQPNPKADYDVRAVVSVLTKAVQELSAEVVELKKQLAAES